MEKIKRNYLDLLYKGYYFPYTHLNYDKEQMNELLCDEDSSGLFFPDIDYKDKNSANWHAIKHLYRIEKAIQSGGAERLHNDPQWLEKILGAFNYWLVNDFDNPNWWFENLAAPKSVANITLMLGELLPDDMFKAAIKIVERAKNTYYGWNWWGANAIWLGSVIITHSLLINDTELMKKAHQIICKEFTYSRNEGPRRDGGFHQHGRKIMSGAYGRSYTFETAPFVKIFAGTDFEIPREKINILLTHILDGQQLLQFKGYFDYGVTGREYSKLDALKIGKILPALELLYTIEDLPRKEEVGRFIDELKGKGKGVSATKWFDSCYYLVNKTDEYYMSVRGVGPNVFGSESVIGQGVLGYNMSYGTNTCFMKTGEEYFNIAPVWDYAKMPGTTARQETDEELKQHGDWNKRPQKNRPINRAKDDAALVVLQPEHDGISLKSTFFVYKDNLIVLGADIKDEKNVGTVLTTVEQSFAKNTVIHSDKYFENAGIHYVNLDEKSKFDCEVKVQTGSFLRNNSGGSDNPVSAEIFTLTVPFGGDGSTYAYRVSAEFPTTDVKVIRNDSKCQAILADDSLLMFMAYEECAIEVCGRKWSLNSGECEIWDIDK